MAPFVPDLISEQLNLVVALLLGIGFGFVLEQAGFSSSRRLAGLFYGYDFTVLRVFFTAAITAMAGILLLGAFGKLDPTAIFVNPTWLWPAVVGGAVMGLGFILGGYCPGTSIVAAAIGKVDAWFFVLGGLLGVFVFGEAYPWLQSFNDSSSLGPVRVYDALGLAPGTFAFLLIVAGIGAFAATGWIERKVSAEAPSRSFPVNQHRLAAGVLVAVGVVLLMLPDRTQRLVGMVTDPTYRQAHALDAMDRDELAFRLADGDRRLKVYDLRPETEYAKKPLPGSTRIELKDLLGRDLVPEMRQVHVRKVFVADNEEEARTAGLLANALGYKNVAALKGGFATFESDILQAAPASTGLPESQRVVATFRQEAKATILRQMAEAKAKGAGGPKKTKKIAGGC